MMTKKEFEEQQVALWARIFDVYDFSDRWTTGHTIAFVIFAAAWFIIPLVDIYL